MAKQPRQVKPEETESIVKEETDRFKNEYLLEVGDPPVWTGKAINHDELEESIKNPKLTLPPEAEEDVKACCENIPQEIVDEVLKDVPFEVMDFQKEVINELQKDVTVIIDKPNASDKSSRATFYMGREPSRR